MNKNAKRTLEYEFFLGLKNAQLISLFVKMYSENLFGETMKLIRINAFKETPSQKRARDIMGENFFGVGEAILNFKFSPTSQQLAALAKVPFSEKLLRLCRETHTLIAVFPFSILDMRRGFRNLFCDNDENWYKNNSFAKESGEICWQLLENFEDSRLKDKQVSLSGGKVVTSARALVYANISHFLIHGCMSSGSQIETSSVSSGEPVYFSNISDKISLRDCFDMRVKIRQSSALKPKT